MKRNPRWTVVPVALVMGVLWLTVAPPLVADDGPTAPPAPKGTWVLKGMSYDDIDYRCPDWSVTKPNCVAATGTPGNLKVRYDVSKFMGKNKPVVPRVAEWAFTWTEPPSRLVPGQLLPMTVGVQRLDLQSDAWGTWQGGITAQFAPVGMPWGVGGILIAKATVYREGDPAAGASREQKIRDADQYSLVKGTKDTYRLELMIAINAGGFFGRAYRYRYDYELGPGDGGGPTRSATTSFERIGVKGATASNVFEAAAEYGAGMAIDADENTRWATDYGIRSAWIEVDLGDTVTVSRMRMIQEVPYAGRIQKFELQYRDAGGWKSIVTGTTTPPEYVKDFLPVTTRTLRLNILDATEGPTINELQFFAAKTK